MTNLQDLIISIREDIPDRTVGDDPHLDGRAFSLATILRWINDAGDLICHNANVIMDWFAVTTIGGQDIYELPDFITSVEQVFYNLLPVTRSAEYDNLFTVKRSGSSWWFSPHSIHAIPKLFLFPAPSEAGAVTALAAGSTSSALSITVDDTTGFNPYGYLGIDNEILRYATVGSPATFTNLLRGQAGTEPAGHALDAVVTDLNLSMKVFRLPRKVEDADGILEMPRGLHPLIQLYVASKVASAEQDKQGGQQMRQEFFSAIEKLSAKPATQGVRQGIQVKTWPDGGIANNVRLYIP